LTIRRTYPVLRRKWEVETDSFERMNIRLFFSEEELNDLATAAGYENVIKLVNLVNLRLPNLMKKTEFGR